MFMIGQGDRVQTLGAAELEHCQNCGEERDFLPQFRYSYGSFNLLFGFVYNRRYALACSTCGHGWFLNTQAAEQRYGKPAIPFLLQYGFPALALFGGILGLAAYVLRHAA